LLGNAPACNAATSGSFTSGGLNFANRCTVVSLFGFATTRHEKGMVAVPPRTSRTSKPVAVLLAT
jgi:hypothetical protein